MYLSRPPAIWNYDKYNKRDYMVAIINNVSMRGISVGQSPPEPPPSGDFILDTFTGAADTLFSDHVGEIGATWSRWFTAANTLNNFKLTGTGELQANAANREVGAIGSGLIPVVPAALYYQVNFYLNTVDTQPGTPDAGVFDSSDATSGTWIGSGGINFALEVQDFGSGNLQVGITARNVSGSIFMNFDTVDTGVSRTATGLHTLRGELNASRDHLKIIFDGSTIYDNDLAEPIKASTYAGLYYFVNATGATVWTIDEFKVGVS